MLKSKATLLPADLDISMTFFKENCSAARFSNIFSRKCLATHLYVSGL